MSKLETIYKVLSLKQLSVDQLDEYYCDLFSSRGDNPIKRIKRRLLQDKTGELHCLLAGFAGCGKSTELNKMQKELENDFFVLNISIQDELDPVNFNYTDLIILIMQRLFEYANDNNLHIVPSLLENIKNWTTSEEISKVKEFSNDFETSIGAEAGFSIPLLSKFFTTLKNVTKLNYSAKKTINEVVEHKLADLLSLCNDLIREISHALLTNNKGLLIIVEDTDKLNIEIASKLFHIHSSVFTSLRTNMIFTYPIALKCSHISNIINGAFDSNVYELPMVKVYHKNGTENAEGINDLIELIKKRDVYDCIESEDLLVKFIQSSGGCIRDLFRMIIDAADYALDDDLEIIEEKHFNKAFIKLKRSYKETIAEKIKEDGSVISANDYYEALEKLNKSTIKQLDNSEVDLDLRHNLSILGYNGEGWYDVHPVVKEILKEREIERESEI
ncbi:P-loop NTPase fold protein [Chryseobacterium sp. RU33C]|uniref:P-loop NTPase fold protein n=1 Tax=Chryseobacterium sp. RU33C TaxID=1907398 RepID=UPI0009571B28|nr:P-loop NTPase fold protein [Chryseobacterium sp. RU33C]SIR44439.1 hypothetical protein SAMN05880573_12327 [Chryseobacterium sp. RU33C]